MLSRDNDVTLEQVADSRTTLFVSNSAKSQAISQRAQSYDSVNTTAHFDLSLDTALQYRIRQIIGGRFCQTNSSLSSYTEDPTITDT